MKDELRINLPEIKKLAKLTREANELLKSNEESEDIGKLEEEITKITSDNE